MWLRTHCHVDEQSWKFTVGMPNKVVVTLKVEKINCETACTLSISKERFVDLLADHKTASAIAQVLMEGVCKKTDTEKMRKYMHMKVKEDGQCASSTESKFKAIRVMSPFGLSKTKVEEATTMLNDHALLLEVTLNLFDGDVASECEVAVKELSVTVACEKGGAENESAVFYKLSQVGEIRRVAAGNNTSRVCFGGTGMASCYKVKGSCIEDGCQEKATAIIEKINLQGRLSRGFALTSS